MTEMDDFYNIEIFCQCLKNVYPNIIDSIPIREGCADDVF